MSPIQGPSPASHSSDKTLAAYALDFLSKSHNTQQLFSSSDSFFHSIFSLAPQHPKHQANEWEGTGEVLQIQITL